MTNTFLSQNSKDFFKLTEDQKKALKKLNIVTVKDVLYHFPSRYEHSSSAKLIRDLVVGETVTVYGKISQLKTGKSFKSKTSKAEGVVNDDTGKIKVLWFHQPYIAKLIQNDSLVKVYGKISEKSGQLSMLNPEIKPISILPNTIGDSLFGEDTSSSHFPVYMESKGITSKWFFHAIQKIFKHPDFALIQDPIPEPIRAKYSLPSLQTSLIWIHAPHKENDAVVARKRFAFEEIFYIQLKNAETRAKHIKEKSFIIEKEESEIDEFLSHLPFKLTDGQRKSADDILKDFKRGHPMSRLLEGDVGSGKTAVAAVTTYAAVSSRPRGQNYGTLQVGYMAPTEILAKQHFESFIKYFKHMPISIGLITGTGCRKFPSKVNPSGWTDISRSQFTKWVASGEISVVIGTHALIQKTVAFKHLAYVIIDEQHRFGTAQRQKLTKKNSLLPHLLSMTATPIPRTLALTIYGDLDLSLLEQMPEGRKKVITKIIKPSGRDEVYEQIKVLLNEGRQAYIICPRINEPDPDKEQKLALRSVKEEALRLKKGVFKDYRIDIMHSKMKTSEKDKVMERFEKHEVDILISTSVVEVGVNVPNATAMIIEGGERFGLSQLHQLRGRVIRGNHQPYCFVFTESDSEKTTERLHALATAKNGFELSELDLKIRGAGELYGGKQWGISDIAMDAIKNIKMVEAARNEARELVERFNGDISTENKNFTDQFPELAKALTERKEIHLE
jgi:ATP-dependent DNA helicase RecG